MKKLGFLNKWEIRSLVSHRSCKYQGFILDLESLKIELTPEKRVSIIERLGTFLKKNSCKIIDFSSIVGILVASCPADDYGQLYLKNSEREKTLALERSGKHYESYMRFTEEVKRDISW